jgi:hypothetical protein
LRTCPQSLQTGTHFTKTNIQKIKNKRYRKGVIDE